MWSLDQQHQHRLGLSKKHAPYSEVSKLETVRWVQWHFSSPLVLLSPKGWNPFSWSVWEALCELVLWSSPQSPPFLVSMHWARLSALNHLSGTYRHLCLGIAMNFRVGVSVCWFRFWLKQIWHLKLLSPRSVSKSEGEIHSERDMSRRVCVPLWKTVDSCVDSQDKIKDNRLSKRNVLIVFLRT